MSRDFLVAANFAAYLLFIYKCFSLIEGMLFGRHFGTLFRINVGIINAGLMVTMATVIPINIAYIVTATILYAELWLLFRRSPKDTLFVTVAVMMNIMCLRGMVMSVLALITNKTLYQVYTNPELYLGTLFVSNTLEWLSLYIIMHYISMEDLRFTMHNKTQSRFIIIWTSLCVLFMFRSSHIYVSNVNLPNMFIDHFSYSAMLLLSFYYFLTYTFRLNRAAKLRETNKCLSIALNNKIQLQSALTRDAIFTVQANLTQNKVISGLEIYKESSENRPTEYDAWLDYLIPKIRPNDSQIFQKSLNRQNLLASHKQGIEPNPFEYQGLSPDNKYHWVRLVLRTFDDVATGDVHLFGYAFDVEKEICEKQALLRSAQTDLLTGVYNKITTEKSIGEAIRKGTGILLLLDIDGFKEINDRYGHAAGDCVLKGISELLNNTFRKCDIVGRVGGDEFMVFIRDTTDSSIAEEKASEILNKLKTAIDCGESRLNVTASIGIAIVDESSDSFSAAYNEADRALYKAKYNGKNCYALNHV